MVTKTTKWHCLSVILLASLMLTACGGGASSSGNGGDAAVISHFWTSAGSMNVTRSLHQATLLSNGKILVTGGGNRNSSGVSVKLASAELYDPATDTWTATASMATSRVSHTSILLSNGKVLVSGGASTTAATASAELYDPTAGTWSPTGSLSTARVGAKATLLPSGKVLVSGGVGAASQPLVSAELYDPVTGIWTATGSLASARFSHTSTLLPNGNVLVTGGLNTVGQNAATPGTVLASAEVYDPSTGTWVAAGSLATARVNHTATLLPTGKVLVTGGDTDVLNGIKFASTELYDPAAGTWTATGSLASGRTQHTATLLADGTVLAAGGNSASAGCISASELYNPTSGTWAATGGLTTARMQHTATLLLSGKVLVAAGYDNTGYVIASSESY